MSILVHHGNAHFPDQKINGIFSLDYKISLLLKGILTASRHIDENFFVRNARYLYYKDIAPITRKIKTKLK